MKNVKVTKAEVRDAMEGKTIPAPEAKPTTVTKIKVLKRDGKFRGARDAWYKRILDADGKTVKDFTDEVLAKPPSTPKKGVLAGKCEPPAGWISYFKRNGFISLEDVKV